MLISERSRSYLPGRMLPMLLGKFRDEPAEFPGKELPSLPQRSGPVKDLLLLKLPREFRDALVIEKADRPRIADELRDKAGVS